ncbi:hypothetical protein PINS_up012418 [Pythium insidiosum]|nr:hypothetical protein PINS_up012418 [Pythium insidiosum]
MADAATILHLVSRLRRWTRSKRVDAARELERLTQSNPHAQRLVAEVGGIPPLVALLKASASDDEKLHATAVLSAIATTDPKHQTRMIDEGVLPLLVALLSSNHEGHKRHAVAAIASLALGGATIQAKIGAAGAIGPLLKILQRGDKELQISAATALWRLSCLPANRPQFLHSTVADLLVLRLSSPLNTVKEHAADVLWNLVTDDERAGRLMLDARAIAPLVTLLRSGTRAQYDSALGAINEVAGLSGASQQLADAGAIPILVACLGDATREVTWKAVAVLGKLAQDPQTRFTIVVSGAVPALVPLLGSPHPLVRSLTANALEELTVDAPQVPPLIIAAGAIDPLVTMLRSSDDTRKDRAATLLWTLSRVEASHRPMQEAGAIPLFVTMLRSTNIRFTRSALMALWYLASDEENRRIIIEAGVAPLLVWLIETADGALQSIAVRCLGTVAKGGYATRVIDAGAIPVLVSILRSASTEVSIKGSAVSTLLTLALENDSAKRLAITAGVVEPMAALLHFGTDDHKMTAVDLLCLLMEDNQDIVSHLVNTGATAVLVSMLWSKERDIVVSAASGLQLISATDAGKHALVSNGAIVALNSVLLLDGNTRSWHWAADALANLFDVESNRRVAVEAGCCGSLLSVAQDSRAPDASSSAVVALWKLCQDPIHRPILVNAGAIPVLSTVLTTDRIVSVMQAVMSSLQDPEFKSLIAEPHVLISLVQRLGKANGLAKTFTLHLLTGFADSSERRRVLVDANIIPELLAVLPSGSYEQLMSALTTLCFILEEDFAANLQLTDAIPQLVELMRREDDVGMASGGALLSIPVQVGTQIDDAVLSALAGLLTSSHSRCVEVGLWKLAEFARDAQHNSRVAEAVSVTTLLALLQESSLQSAAAAIIHSLALQLPATIVIPSLVSTLKMPLEDSTRDTICSALHNLSFDEANRQQIIDEGAIEALVPMLAVNPSSTARLLRRLATTHDALRAIMDAGAVHSLVSMVESRDPQDAPVGLCLMGCFLSMNDDAKRVLLDAGVVELMASSLFSETDTLQFEAAKGLCHLDLSEHHAFLIEAAGVIPKALSHLENGDDNAKHHALSLLWCIAECSERLESSFIAAGALEALSTILESRNELLQIVLTGCVWALSQRVPNRALLQAIGAAPFLREGLLTDNDNVKVHAAAALWNLDPTDDARQLIVNANVLEIIRSHLTGDQLSAREDAAVALSNLAVANTNQRLIMATDGMIDALTPLLRGCYEQHATHAAAAFAILMSNEDIARTIATEAIDALRALADNGTDAQRRHAATALDRLSTHADAL